MCGELLICVENQQFATHTYAVTPAHQAGSGAHSGRRSALRPFSFALRLTSTLVKAAVTAKTLIDPLDMRCNMPGAKGGVCQERSHETRTLTPD